MLPNLPLDVEGNQIRIGHKVAYGAPDSCHMFIGRVVKMTNCFAWVVPVGFEDDYKFNRRREFNQMIVLGE